MHLQRTYKQKFRERSTEQSSDSEEDPLNSSLEVSHLGDTDDDTFSAGSGDDDDDDDEAIEAIPQKRESRTFDRKAREYDEKETETTVRQSTVPGLVLTDPRGTAVPESHLETIVHFTEPSYEVFPPSEDAGPDHCRVRGGRLSEAVLGPGSDVGWSDAQSTRSLAALRVVRPAYPGVSFVAGHLLNAAFGGIGGGEDGTNITALTYKANMAMKDFDEPVKEAVLRLRKVYELLNDLKGERANFLETAKEIGYGIRVRVEVGEETWGEDYPACLVAEKIRCTATIENAEEVTRYFEDHAPRSTLKAHVLEGRKKTLEEHLKAIEDLVAQANEHEEIDNSERSARRVGPTPPPPPGVASSSPGKPGGTGDGGAGHDSSGSDSD